MLRQALLFAALTAATLFASGGCQSCSSCHDYDPPVAGGCDACGTHRAGSACSGCAGGSCASGGYVEGGYDGGQYGDGGYPVENSQPAPSTTAAPESQNFYGQP